MKIIVLQRLLTYKKLLFANQFKLAWASVHTSLAEETVSLQNSIEKACCVIWGGGRREEGGVGGCMWNPVNAIWLWWSVSLCHQRSAWTFSRRAFQHRSSGASASFPDSLPDLGSCRLILTTSFNLSPIYDHWHICRLIPIKWLPLRNVFKVA